MWKLNIQSTIMRSKLVFKRRQNEKFNDSGIGSSTNSVATCHKCSQKFHIKIYCRSNINGSDGDLSKRSTRKLPKWVTKKPVISDVEYLTTSTMNRNNKM